MKWNLGLCLLAVFAVTSCATYQLAAVDPISAKHDGITVDAYAVWVPDLRFDVTVTNRSGHRILVDSDDFRIYVSPDEQSWRPIRMYRSAEVYRRAFEEAANRPVIVAVGPGSPVYTRETTIIRGNGVTTVTRVRRNPLYDPQYVIVSPNPDEQLADFRSSLFYSASIDDGQFKDGYVFAQRVEGPFIKLSVPIEGQLFEIVFQRVKVPGVFTNLN